MTSSAVCPISFLDIFVISLSISAILVAHVFIAISFCVICFGDLIYNRDICIQFLLGKHHKPNKILPLVCISCHQTRQEYILGHEHRYIHYILSSISPILTFFSMHSPNCFNSRQALQTSHFLGMCLYMIWKIGWLEQHRPSPTNLNSLTFLLAVTTHDGFVRRICGEPRNFLHILKFNFNNSIL